MVVYDSCDDSTGWGTTGATVITVDTADFVSAPASLKAVTPSGQYMCYLAKWTWYMDFSAYPIITFYVKVSRADKPLSLMVNDTGDAAGEHHYPLTGLVADTWQKFTVDLRQVSVEGTVPDLHHLRAVRLDWELQNAEGTLHLDQIEFTAGGVTPPPAEEVFDSCDAVDDWVVESSKAIPTQGDNTLEVDTVDKMEGAGSLKAVWASNAPNWGGVIYKRPTSGLWDFSQKPILRIRMKIDKTLPSLSFGMVTGQASGWEGFGYDIASKIPVGAADYAVVEIDLRTPIPRADGMLPDLSLIKQFSFSTWNAYVELPVTMHFDFMTKDVGTTLPLQVTITPKNNQTVYAGDKVNFSATAVGGSTPYVYAWYVNNQAVASGSTFTFSESATGTYNVKSVVTDAAGNTASSAVVAVTVLTLPPPFTPTAPNAMLIYDQPWLYTNQNILGNMPKVISDLSRANCKFAIIFVGYYNATDPTHPTVAWVRSAAFYQNVISQLHAIGVKAIAWIEDGGGGTMDIRPANWQNIYSVILEAMNMGFDGYFDDIEGWVDKTSGVDQKQIDWLNSLTPVLHNIGKLNMPAVGYDWLQGINNKLYVDYICTMFYSNRSTFEDPQGPYYWQENFGEYQGNNKPPTSPVIVFIFNAVYNANPLSWQLNEATKYLGLYGHPNLYGFGIWLYEYMTDADWVVWNEWVKTLPQYGVPPLGATVNLTISTNDVSMGTTDPAPGTYQITQGSSTQVSAIPQTGYMLGHWELDGVNVSTSTPYSVTMDKNHTLLAVFVIKPPPPPGKQHLTISSTTGGTTTPTTGVWEYDQGSTAQVTATPNTGYRFKHWLLDNVIAGLDPTITVTMDADHTLVAVYEAVSPTPITSSMLLPALGLLAVVGIGYLATRKKR